MRFTALASGSSGNAGLLESNGLGLLVDLGLGPRQLASRLAQVGRQWDHIQALILTHVHGDHWNERSFAHLVRREIVVYCHPHHQRFLQHRSEAFANLASANLVRHFTARQELILGPSLSAWPIPLSHDGRATFGFRFEGGADLFGRRSLGYAADLGSWSAEVVEMLANVDALALEFNHDVTMEVSSGRSPRLVQRVLGTQGHLSNEQAAQLVQTIVDHSPPSKLRHLLCLHLSQECNRAALAKTAARRILPEESGVAVHAALPDRSSATIHIGSEKGSTSQRSTERKRSKRGRIPQPMLPGFE